jgi:UDP-N-acetylglucosamine 2-epimerase (non-hydrolysing)
MKNNKNKKIMVIIGTRPEAIKLAPVIKELRKDSNYTVIVCATAQHRDLLDQMLETFKIKVHYDFNLMSKNQSVAGFFQKALEEINKLMEKIKPDMTIVQGDTSTAAAGALASFYNKIPLAHVEAGLRSGDMKNPFPEEVNRILADNLSDLLFVPTEQSKKNLIKEGFGKSKIYVTGNTVIDTLKSNVKKLKKNKDLQCCTLFKKFKIILVTLHRRESFGKDMLNILKALKDIVKQNEKVLIIYPVHPNPNIQKAAQEILKHARIMLIKPLSYLDFLSLMMQSDLIITDSGGVQEEAPALKKYVIVARKKTERTEGIDKGCVFLSGPSRAKIVKSANEIIRNPKKFSRACKNIYGDGNASKKIAKNIACFFKKNSK